MISKFKNFIKILILFLTPLIYENIGMKFGGPIGIKYYYSESFNPKFLGLPILVWIFWVIFIFIAYNLTNSIFINLFKKDYKNLLNNFFYFLVLILLDGFIVTTFDFFIDPIAVKYKLWRWENFKESYFGVPIGNFVGWYIIGSTTTFFLRILDKTYFKNLNVRFQKIFPFIYIIIILTLFFLSIVFYNFEFAIQNLILSSPINLLSLILIKNDL
jgi:putative membrane protein